MGKEARERQREESRFRSAHAAASTAVAEARNVFHELWEGLEGDFTRALRPALGGGRRVRINAGELHRAIGERRAAGWAWPSSTYVPSMLAGAMVLGGTADEIGLDRNSLLDDGLAVRLGAQLSSLLGWHRAPLVAVFDDDLAVALEATPTSGDIPRALLERLPAWTVYIPLSSWPTPAGVFVSYDSGRMTQPHTPATAAEDDLVMQFVVQGELPLLAFFRCSEATIGQSMEVQFRSLAAKRAHGAFDAAESDRRARELLGVPYRDAIERVMSLTLYLCSDEPDLASLQIPGRSVRSRAATITAPDLFEVGYRVGASLRAGNHSTATGGEAVAGQRRPTPHVRAAHWHTYWYGPRDDPAARSARLRWVSPILVNASDSLPVPTARPVGADHELGRHR